MRLILACALSLAALSPALAHCPVPDPSHHCTCENGPMTLSPTPGRDAAGACHHTDPSFVHADPTKEEATDVEKLPSTGGSPSVDPDIPVATPDAVNH